MSKLVRTQRVNKTNILIAHTTFIKNNHSNTNKIEFCYDNHKSAWITHNSEFACSMSSFESLGTKKCDVETGEDMKGE